MDDYCLYANSVLFNTRDIQNRIVSLIKDEKTVYIVGCAAWLTNTSILHALLHKPCTIVCNPPPYQSIAALYNRCVPYYKGLSSIILLDQGTCQRHNMQALLHHKFLLGLDSRHIPIWLVNGSFNFTNHALCNIENMTVSTDSADMQLFFVEYQRVLGLVTKSETNIRALRDLHSQPSGFATNITPNTVH